jgi:hypothetical protein
MAGLREGDEIAINEASSAIKAKLKAKTPQGETRRFNWIDIWNETFDRLHGIERDDPRIRDVTLQRLLDNQIVIKDRDDVVFRHT